MAKKSNTRNTNTGLGSSFKLSKTSKRVMSLQYTDAHLAGAYKRSMIIAEYTYSVNKKKQPSRADVAAGD